MFPSLPGIWWGVLVAVMEGVGREGQDGAMVVAMVTPVMMTTMTMTTMTMGIDEGGWEGVLKINAFLPFSCVCVGRGGEGEGVEGE